MHSVRLTAAILAVATVSAYGFAASPRAQTSTDDPRQRGPLCSKGNIVIKSREARVIAADRLIGGCWRGQIRSWMLADYHEEFCWEDYCTVEHPVLAGKWFAFATQSQSDGRDPDSGYYGSYVKVFDLQTTAPFQWRWSMNAGVGGSASDYLSVFGRGPVKALVLSRAGAVAFIAKDVVTPKTGYRVYSALRTLDGNYQPPAELGKGTTIQPRTLKLVGGAATWKQNGKHNIAPLR